MTVLKQIITHLSQNIGRVTVKSVPTFPFLFPHLFQVFSVEIEKWFKLSEKYNFMNKASEEDRG